MDPWEEWRFYRKHHFSSFLGVILLFVCFSKYKAKYVPLEIRDMIYSECATVLEGYPIALFYKSKDHASCVRSDCHSLLQVCRQLRHEFLSTYYSNTNFQIQAKHLLRFNTLLSKVKAPSPPAIHAEIGCCTPVCVHSKDILQVMNFRVKHMKTSINLIGAKITRPIGIVDALGQRLIVTQPYHLDDREVEMWQKLVANTNRNWLGLFRERQLAGLMLARTGNCKVLMKCEHAPAWMKRNPSPPERDVLLYAEKLGFTKELMGRGSWPIFPANGPRLEFRVYYW